MKRNMIATLQNWMKDEKRKPFYLTGMKGSGKTYLACEFSKAFFDSYLYLSFEHNKELVTFFEQLPEEQVLPALAAYFEFPEEYVLTIPFVFDEIHLCPGFISKLLRQIEEQSSLYWIFISSYDVLTDTVKEKLNCHILFPLQFDEFLAAIGKDWYIEVITAHYQNKKRLPDMVHRELLSTFDEYLWIGGMPDVLNEYLNMESSVNVTERQYIQKQLLLHGMSLVAEERTSFKCQQIYSTIDEQLLKTNQKFQFNLIRKGITYQMYKDALDFLVQHHMLYRLNSIGKEQQFKLFYPDFSLNYSARNDELTDVERHIRLENYLIQTLIEKKQECYFWEAKSQAVIDFVLVNEQGEYTPVELKQEKKSKSKSILSFKKQYNNTKNIVRISSDNFVENDEFFNIPLYSIFCI